MPTRGDAAKMEGEFSGCASPIRFISKPDTTRSRGAAMVTSRYAYRFEATLARWLEGTHLFQKVISW